MESYVLKSNNTVVQYILTRPIIELCEETVRIPGTWIEKSWLGQEVLDLAGARAAEEGGVERWREIRRSSVELRHGTEYQLNYH